jgi:hypothetical protein
MTIKTIKKIHMKKLFLLFISSLFLNFLNAQNKPDISGIWQVKRNGQFLKANDLMPVKQLKDKYVFYLFSTDTAYMFFTSGKEWITSDNVPDLILKGYGIQGTYKLYDRIAAIENNQIRKFFEENAPYKTSTFFINVSLKNETMNFCYEPEEKRIYAPNKDIKKYELVKVD